MVSEFPEKRSPKKVDTIAPSLSRETRQVLVVDSDEKNQTFIETTLSRFAFKKKPVSLIKADSIHDAQTLISKTQNIAVMLLHLSRKTITDGRWLIHYIRESVKDKTIRIIIQTDTLDDISHEQMLEESDIHDIFTDAEINAQKINTVFATALASHENIQALHRQLRQKQTMKNGFLESEQRFKEITISIGDLIWEMDRHGKYTYVSDNITDITGYSMEELNEIHFSAMFKEKETSIAQKRICHRTKACLPFKNIEIWKQHKNKKRLCFLTNGRPMLDDTGTLIGYRGIDRDITEYKLSEKENERLMAQLNQVQRLEALGTLAGGIAHDFNNILGVILGYTQLLQMDVSSDSKTSHFTRQIIDGCNRAKNLTLQILDFSRLKEEEDTPPSPIIPTSVVKEKLKMLRATIPSSITINSDIPQKTGRVLATPNQIYQIITNLMTNAYQAMEGKQGTISLAMKDISLTAENYTPTNELNLPHGDYVTIEVEDNGKGITTELRDKIFDPYFTTKQGGDGRGLGLSVVHSIITRCKGGVVLESQPGKGTVITIYLPACPDEQKKNRVMNNAIATGEGKILFVDDEKMLVDLGKMMLERIGYQAVALQSPSEALAAFKKESDSFDLVITDLTMPGLQGTQLAREIKKIKKEVPVILATGFDSRTALGQDENQDIDALLSKPLSINSLSETIKKFLK
ncbi:PAS domain S-box-containing protein [Desulfocicer vacuolatum DSM 3385]|uniref:histidine kinase n=1 Tax=Desulfocicer vacuolatum DSM 3385 TaxID=1121400 RepID=A0A1W2B9D4_9BACT|nr:ATP-binding protein [Desulfocicer vacuolatum]SMC69401.1 PAS domain S-box-containing protein [Desulfocicer vacuolatum DSM 3385]